MQGGMSQRLTSGRLSSYAETPAKRARSAGLTQRGLRRIHRSGNAGKSCTPAASADLATADAPGETNVLSFLESSFSRAL